MPYQTEQIDRNEKLKELRTELILLVQSKIYHKHIEIDDLGNFVNVNMHIRTIVPRNNIDVLASEARGWEVWAKFKENCKSNYGTWERFCCNLFELAKLSASEADILMYSLSPILICLAALKTLDVNIEELRMLYKNGN